MTTTRTHLPGKFVWFEHVGSDVARARAFYEPLFGWHVESMPMGGEPYQLVMRGEQGIGGLRSAPAGVPSHWISYMSVPDVDAAHAAAVAAGAKVQMPPTSFGDVGRASGLADPTGASFCLWKGANGDAPDTAAPAAGDWVWNELWTPDPKAALAFYERAFGYTHDAMDMGPQGTYYMLKKGDAPPRGGLMSSAGMPDAPPMWLPYVAVADCDATCAQAQRLGAQKIIVPPTDIPNIGRFCILLDPVGAALGAIRMAPPA